MKTYKGDNFFEDHPIGNNNKPISIRKKGCSVIAINFYQIGGNFKELNQNCEKNKKTEILRLKGLKMFATY